MVKCNFSAEQVWDEIFQHAQEIASSEAILERFLHTAILDHNDLASALAKLLSEKLATRSMPAATLESVFQAAFTDQEIISSVIADIAAIYERDSACKELASALLYYKGFHALSAWRAAHQLWLSGQKAMALLLQHRISVTFGVDIHPAASIGKGIMFDHATGLVIGETAVVENCVSILQGVTLGGTGKDSGDRHPKVRQGVLIGPGAKILGNIEIGKGSKITAASVVLQNIPPHSLVAGVPAKVIGSVRSEAPAEEMDQSLGC